MSLRRLGLNPDGTRRTVDDGPAYARRQGFGGQAIGSFNAPTVVLKPPRVRIPRAPLKRVRPVCGTPLQRDLGPCAGIPNHRGHHRSALAMANRAVGRRG